MERTIIMVFPLHDPLPNCDLLRVSDACTSVSGGFAFTAYIFDVFTYGWNGIGQMFIPGLDRLMEWFDFEYIRRFAGLTLPAAFLGILIYYTCAYWENKLHDRILWFAWIISMLVNIAETVFVMETGMPLVLQLPSHCFLLYILLLC